MGSPITPTQPVFVQPTGPGNNTANFTAQSVGGLLYPQTVAEIAASVVPMNYGYPAGDIRRYGALGNSANDTAAINVAVSIPSQPAFVPPNFTSGVFAPIILPAGAFFYGFGDSSILKLLGNTVMIRTAASNVSVQNMQLNGNSGTFNTNTNDGIHIDWTGSSQTDVLIKGVTMRNIGGAGVIALGDSMGTHVSSDLRVLDCDIQGCGAHGILSQDYISNVTISRNTVKNTGLNTADRPGITASRNGANVIISDNNCVGSASALGVSVHGISVDTTTLATVTGNALTNWIGVGIECGFSSDVTISGNSITASGNSGIFLSGAPGSPTNNNVSILCNTIISPVGDGITAFVTGAVNANTFHSNIVISGNVIKGSTTQNGINLTLCFNNSVTNNIITGCFLSGLVFTDCRETMVAGNTVINNNVTALKTVSSITQAAGTATVTTAANHGYATNNVVTIMNAVPAEYNGPQTITVTGATTFTYPVLPTTLQSPALPLGAGIQCSLSNSGAGGGVKINYSLLTTKELMVFGHNLINANGFLDYYDQGYNGVIGMWNDSLYLKGTTPPRVENLTSGVATNQEDRVAITMKNKKVTFSYNNAGTVNFLTGTLDGTTATWTNSSSIP